MIATTFVPVRHFEWGANLNLCQIAAYGWSTEVTQCAMVGKLDRLGMAQHLSRIALHVDGNTGTSLADARSQWIGAQAWEGLRLEMDRVFSICDWFEVLVARSLVADGLLYPLFSQQINARMVLEYGPALSIALDYLMSWQDETANWIDGMLAVAVSESETNRILIQGWLENGMSGFSRH
jgi:phenol hydroxylase P1 protein